MSGLLRDKVAFVTGGAGGIGRASAIAFAREGATVVVSDLTAPADTVAAFEDPTRGEAIALDVTDGAAVNAAIAALVVRHGRLDIAFNNAGVSLEDNDTPWDATDLYDRVVAVNQRGVYLCMAAELRVMAAQAAGAIVNTASIAGMVGLSGAGYCGSKHAVIGFTQSAAIRYAAQGIRINAVCPGVIETPMTQALLTDPRGAAAMAQMAPMGRVARPEEVAEAVVFLASEAASFITGHPLAVDGGYLAR